MVYRLPDSDRIGLLSQKIENQKIRSLAFMRQVDAAHAFPSSGPPCFLDEDLFHLNDLNDDGGSIYYDQLSFLEYLRSRPPLATRDSEHGLELVHTYCRSREEQQRAVAALRFKCDLLWAQLDALYYHCVDPTKAIRGTEC